MIIIKEEGIQKDLTIGVNHRAAMIEFTDINTNKEHRDTTFLTCEVSSTNKKPKILVRNTSSKDLSNLSQLRLSVVVIDFLR